MIHKHSGFNSTRHNSSVTLYPYEREGRRRGLSYPFIKKTVRLDDPLLTCGKRSNPSGRESGTRGYGWENGGESSTSPSVKGKGNESYGLLSVTEKDKKVKIKINVD